MKTLNAGRLGLGAACLGASKRTFGNVHGICKATKTI